ncbi:MAG: hypothetical protein M3R24_03560, partial [Chloroflexota bacterium]|nr:hypothetical protein [Chloroflexota bacterium]
RPDTPNTLLAWDGVAWSWFKRHTLLEGRIGGDTAPAVLVLDGSANSAIAERLYAPWPVEGVAIDAPLSPLVTVVQCKVTASTRRIVRDTKTLDSVTRAVMAVCNHLDILIDGGISYLKAEQQLAEQLGGTWLHYGGQRGNNALKDARALAIIASPTTPPDAIERKALALWSADPAPIICDWVRVGRGDYRAVDARLEAMNRMHGLEELRQAAHRCRPISSTAPTTLLIFSPWDIAAIGFTPSLKIKDVPHGNSTNSAQAAARYAARRAAATTRESEHAHHFDDFQSPLINNASIPTIENTQSDPQPRHSPPISRSSNERFGKSRSDARGSFIAVDDPWVKLQSYLAECERRAGNFERAAFYQGHVDRARGVARPVLTEESERDCVHGPPAQQRTAVAGPGQPEDGG